MYMMRKITAAVILLLCCGFTCYSGKLALDFKRRLAAVESLVLLPASVKLCPFDAADSTYGTDIALSAVDSLARTLLSGKYELLPPVSDNPSGHVKEMIDTAFVLIDGCTHLDSLAVPGPVRALAADGPGRYLLLVQHTGTHQDAGTSDPLRDKPAPVVLHNGKHDRQDAFDGPAGILTPHSKNESLLRCAVYDTGRERFIYYRSSRKLSDPLRTATVGKQLQDVLKPLL